MPSPEAATSALVPRVRPAARFHIGFARWRRKRILERTEGVTLVRNHAEDVSYCTRLLEVYDSMRSVLDPRAPRQSTLLSHVPEWAQQWWQDDKNSREGRFLLETLVAIPRLQAALANCTAYTPSKWLLEKEMGKRCSNAEMDKLPKQAPTDEEDLSARYADLDSRPKSWGPRSPRGGNAEDVYDAAARERLAGIGLSGGGIRSATFCLGVLQTLATHGLLGRFDYIASVSGGGYIHQWLAAWIHREPRGLASVQEKMKPLPSSQSLGRGPEQINWLRRYSSYLTPQSGIASVDTWTLAAIWMRNTFLNQIVLASFFAVCLLGVRALMHPFTMPMISDSPAPDGVAVLVNRAWQWTFVVLTIVCAVLAANGVNKFRGALASQTDPPLPGSVPPEGAICSVDVVASIVLPGFGLSVLAALASAGIFRVHDLLFGRVQCGAAGPPTCGQQAYGLGFAHSLPFALHPVVLLWAIYVGALLIAQTAGGRAFNSSRRNSPSFPAWASHAGLYAGAVLCALLAAGTAFYLSGHSMGGASVLESSRGVAKSLDTALLGKVKPPAKDKGGDKSKGAAIKPCAAQPAAVDGCAAVADGKGGAAAPAANAGEPAAGRYGTNPRAALALFLPLLFFGAQFLAIRLNLGLIGRSYEESRREWLARYGAWAAIVSFLWMGFGAIALFGPSLFYSLFDVSRAHALASWAGVLILHGITLYSGGSSKTSGTPNPRKFFGYNTLDLVGIVGAPLAIISLMILTSGLVEAGTSFSFHAVYDHVTRAITCGAPFHTLRHYALTVSGPVLLFALFATCLLLFGWRVDVNEFSLHPFYRDRLARCYIGASNGSRVPDPFTGFDDHTEVSINNGIRLAQLLPARFGGQVITVQNPRGGPPRHVPPYDGPLPIFCSTVNLTFGGDLAYKDRKGASFAFTPMYTGYHVSWTSEQDGGGSTTFNGFVPTVDYAYRGEAEHGHSARRSGVPLTTAAAISGAALSPNQGFSSQPALAFLMTLFNVRLGWWIANTRKPYIWPRDLDQPSPRFGLRYLLAELFGQSTDTTNYLCLSDGGFFDNMGLYELVRRRCKLIVICDGEEDLKTTFQGIGMAIAKARIDFGVEITFPPEQVERLTPGEKGKSAGHFAVGTIRYPAPPGQDSDWLRYSGKIVYLKTAFVGDEPMDIRHYKREHPDFPQESTLNQWFTEPQFESYRRLGQITAEQAIEEIKPHA